MSRDVITVGSTMRIPLLYRGEYSQWRERFMNYLEEQTDGEAMINSIQNGDHPLPVIAQVSLAGTAPNAPPTLKDPQFWTAEEKKNRKIDRLARSLLIQGLPNDIYSLIDSNDTAKDLWDALERQMRGSEYGEQDRKCRILQVILDLQHFKSSLLILTTTMLQSSSAIRHISNIDNIYHHSGVVSPLPPEKVHKRNDNPLPVPFAFRASQSFGTRKGKFHGGIDTHINSCNMKTCELIHHPLFGKVSPSNRIPNWSFTKSITS
ncbi:hypothetical protein Tco_1538100 [Tanacetum coccineum]